MRKSAVAVLPGGREKFSKKRRRKMNNLNSVLLEGNLIDNPSFKKIKGELPVCKFTIRSSRHFVEDGGRIKEDSYFDIVVYDKQAEVCKEYLEKDRGVRVIGRLKQERWKDDKGRRSHIHIVAEHVEFKPNFKKWQELPDKRGNRKEET
jgi:single-strand DNA-binding protein